MSRYKPVSLRHKSHAEHSKYMDMAQTLATLGLRIAALACWTGSVSLCVSVARNLIDNSRSGAGLAHWEPAALAAGALVALVLGCRVWALKRWACIAAVVAAGLLCFIAPWRSPDNLGTAVDAGQAIATSLVACLLFVVPLIAAVVIERDKLKPGF